MALFFSYILNLKIEKDFKTIIKKTKTSENEFTTINLFDKPKEN